MDGWPYPWNSPLTAFPGQNAHTLDASGIITILYKFWNATQCFDLPNDDYQNRSAGDCAVRGVKKEALKICNKQLF
jgi:hypothetical protein